MHIHWVLRGLGTAIGLAAAALSVAPEPARAWQVEGGTLDLSQRDVRVFNNFADPEANANQIPDPNFPGALGAPLAIWKAVAEWGSVRRHDGLGDPTQFEIGSGGANFDSTWQGLATGVGGTNDNIASEIAGSSLGIIAFTELPIADGWRIRFYADGSVLHDAPAGIPNITGHKDIQGVMAHEYGHALGLAHEGSDSALTMFPSASGSLVERRSIEPDDIAGVQALYGVRAATKPRITFYALSGNALTLEGSNFAPLDNEVWFTDGSASADGSPLRVTGLASQRGGTRIALTIPASALAGDVLVKIPGNDGASLSNAFPFDPLAPPCPVPVVYGTAKMTSQFTLPELSVSGRPLQSTNDFAISTSGGIANATGVIFSGAGPTAAPFYGGTLLASRPLTRMGMFQFDFLGGVTIPIPVTNALIGTTRCFQLWFNDAGDPYGVGLSNAVRVTFCP